MKCSCKGGKGNLSLRVMVYPKVVSIHCNFCDEQVEYETMLELIERREK